MIQDNPQTKSYFLSNMKYLAKIAIPLAVFTFVASRIDYHNQQKKYEAAQAEQRIGEAIFDSLRTERYLQKERDKKNFETRWNDNIGSFEQDTSKWEPFRLEYDNGRIRIGRREGFTAAIKRGLDYWREGDSYEPREREWVQFLISKPNESGKHTVYGSIKGQVLKDSLMGWYIRTVGGRTIPLESAQNDLKKISSDVREMYDSGMAPHKIAKTYAGGMNTRNIYETLIASGLKGEKTRSHDYRLRRSLKC